MAKWTTNDIPDQSGRTVIVTGSTSGIGKETARVLAHKGAKVIQAVRNVEKGEGVSNEIREGRSDADVLVMQLDLTDLSSVRSFTDSFLRDHNRLDLLINNAGIMMCPYSKTKDGFEIQIGTNHMGHFALTAPLLPALKAAPGSRIVNVSSIAHRQGNIDFDDLQWEKRDYNTQRAYCDSKIANLYFTYEFGRRHGGDANAPMVTAAHPGWTGTDLQRHNKLFEFLNNFFAQKPLQGALPTLRAAIDPAASTGDYFGPANFFEFRGHPVKVKSTKRSHDEAAAKKLWEVSEELTAVSL